MLLADSAPIVYYIGFKKCNFFLIKKMSNHSFMKDIELTCSGNLFYFMDDEIFVSTVLNLILLLKVGARAHLFSFIKSAMKNVAIFAITIIFNLRL